MACASASPLSTCCCIRHSHSAADVQAGARHLRTHAMQIFLEQQSYNVVQRTGLDNSRLPNSR
eukprot:CAMPEP_0184082872 /NCGR_PEP_ID=MMETSP0974-20121125/3423_1 /TAXON_ID=483370 /ORGANISM="non described non described, Strain CCMP2097" /LENGTH=62 /DNA_ID=CAMNT_0026385547 /DNA_START=187 /DNA_END=375 /DNA_ORIENTATION=-